MLLACFLCLLLCHRFGLRRHCVVEVRDCGDESELEYQDEWDDG